MIWLTFALLSLASAAEDGTRKQAQPVYVASALEVQPAPTFKGFNEIQQRYAEYNYPVYQDLESRGTSPPGANFFERFITSVQGLLQPLIVIDYAILGTMLAGLAIGLSKLEYLDLSSLVSMGESLVGKGKQARSLHPEMGRFDQEIDYLTAVVQNSLDNVKWWDNLPDVDTMVKMWDFMF